MPEILPIAAPRPIGLDLTPCEVAARLRHLPGLVFFDTAKPDGDALSIVAAAPARVIRGDLARDWQTLRTELAARAIDGGRDDGLPHGFAAGGVGYEGAFCFGGIL